MKTLLCLALFIFIPLKSFAIDGGGRTYDFRQKADRKEASRWTLQEFLRQSERNRMMDLWLSMHMPSPYEFYLGGAYQDYVNLDNAANTQSRYSSAMGTAGAYATIVGLEGFYENNIPENYSQSGGSFNLRVMGNGVQATHLSFNYGYRSLKMNESSLNYVINQTFAGADLNLYLTRYFGISGAYRYYQPVEIETLGKISGDRTEGGVFIDFSFLRVFGSWYSEKLITHPNQSERSIDRTGIMSGIKIFF